MKSVLSTRKMKSKATLLGKSLEDVAKEVGLGHGYIYRLGGKDTMSLNTINRIAQALKCSACDLMDEVNEGAGAPIEPVSDDDIEGAVVAPRAEPTQSKMGKASDALRDRLKEELTEGVSVPSVSDSKFLAGENDRRAMLIAQASQRIR